jgi:inosine-uridine nucleoside N-ribohydrolase
LALRLQPSLAARLPRLVTMAGAYQQGNTTPSAEFNVLADPEAAHIVFNAGVPLTMIGLEVCLQALVTTTDLARLRERTTSAAKIAATLVEPQIGWYIDNLGWDGGPIFDACAVAAVVDPAVVQTQAARVDIELSGEHTRGRTVADLRGYDSRPPNVDVGVGINRQRFIDILFEAFFAVGADGD